MPADAVPLRSGQESHAEAIKRLREEAAQYTAQAQATILSQMSALWRSLSEAKDFPITPGEKEEYRRLADYIGGADLRLQALAGRRL
jgi:hypothetical protein